MKKNQIFAGLCCFLCFSAVTIWAQSAPPPFRLRQNFITGLSSPVHLTNAKDGTRRIFIVQQRGIVKVVQPGSSTTADFLNISTVVSSSGFERGLLGLAFHPQYSSNRRFFVYYTRQSDGAIEIAEYSASTADPNRANPAAVRIIITIPHPTNANHNGGTIAFGPDGLLYAATGDGGSGNDPPNNAQNINILLGKFIRLDINTPVGQIPLEYNIPPTNPYAGATPGRDEIYAVGLRNPYRFSFDRGGTNQLWVGDVGQNAIEEVDIITLGGNYGWRVYEGTQCTNLDASLCIPANYIPPVFEYNRVGTPRCSVTGGYVYRGNQNALPKGSYIFGDYCSGEILLWHNTQQLLLLDTDRSISSFGEDEDGELYVVGLGGTVDKILGNKTSADFDGDLKTDLSVFRPQTGVWYVQNSLNGSATTQQFGLANDIPAAEDYDGDFKTDIGVFRPSNGTWYFMNSSSNTVSIAQFGLSGDIPAAGDYDGDGKADLTVYRPSNGVWYTFRSSDFGVSSRQFGLSGDVPTPGDFDGDGRYDLAVWRPSDGFWYQLNSTSGSSTIPFGQFGDIPATGDFDGDGRNDRAVFRPSTGVWYIMRSTGGVQITAWGQMNDVPVVGDYDSDGRDDIAVFRPSTGVWYALRSTSGVLFAGPFGLPADLPVPSYDNP